MRRAARTDRNQTEIIDALRKIGASVRDTSMVGQGFPDLVCGFRGRTYLFECKDGSKAASRRQLTEAQKRFHREWRGTVDVIESSDQAIAILTGGR